MDEIVLLIFPAIDGHSGTCTIFDGGGCGLADGVALTLSSVERGEAGGCPPALRRFGGLKNPIDDAGVKPGDNMET